MKPIPQYLSKSKLMRGYRCLKCIYLTIHQPELEAPLTPDTLALFKQGNEVGAKAREYFPGGTLVDNSPWDFSGAINKTKNLIADGITTIYEAAFEYMGFFARTDIIQYSHETHRWRIYEVKSTTRVKPEHYDDVGVQAWIIAKSGLPIDQINLVHLNSDCRYPDLSNLFHQEDITTNIREKYLTIKPTIKNIYTTIQQPTVPDIDIGSYCLEPTECGFTEHCWQQKKIPDMSILNLPGMKDRKWDLYNDGVIALDDPRLSDLNALQERIVTCFKTNKRYIDIKPIQAELSNWQFPLIFLDFETINPAIPRYDGCRPYEQLPFQFSVHTWLSPNADITHTEFLHDSADDPRPTLIPALIQACGEQGSIVAYHAKFEIDRIKALAGYSAEYCDALTKLIDRFVDPLPLIRNTVYDNAFNGSFSLKAVAPALLGPSHSYKDMSVANGGDAQRAFEELISPNIAASKKLILRKAMLEYCKKDTFVMVDLVKWLYQQISH